MSVTLLTESEAKGRSLADLNGLLKSHADHVKELIEKGGETLALNDAEVVELRSHNDQMSLLGKTRDDKLELLKIGQRATEEIAGQKDVSRTLPHPTDRAPAPNGSGRASSAKGIGDQFIDSDVFKGYRPSERRSPALDLDVGSMLSMRFQGYEERKALMVSADVAGIIQPEALFGGQPLEMLTRRPVVADLIPQGTTGSPSMRYVEETVNTNNADFVAEGGTKPESALGFADRTATVRKIATVLPVTDELFADAPAMRSYVEARLRLFMSLREESSLVAGTGVGLEYYGLLNVPGSQTKATSGSGGNVLDTMMQAMVAIQVNSFLEPSGVIMNPLDWADIITLKTADGVYIWGQPNAAPGVERVWGMPVVSTPVMPQNTAVVAAFNSAMQIFRREGVTFSVSDQHADFFITNKLMLRVEERLAFVIYRPSGVCIVTGV
jgi:HK97 family phage major capsid protein